MLDQNVIWNWERDEQILAGCGLSELSSILFSCGGQHRITPHSGKCLQTSESPKGRNYKDHYVWQVASLNKKQRLRHGSVKIVMQELLRGPNYC